MNAREFEGHLSQFFVDLRRITSSKGVEYANDTTDQLANFKRLAVQLGLLPEQVALVYLTKHLDSIQHAVRTGKVLSEPLHGRCLDAVLYLILLDAIHTEKLAAQTPSEKLDLDHDPMPPSASGVRFGQ